MENDRLRNILTESKLSLLLTTTLKNLNKKFIFCCKYFTAAYIWFTAHLRCRRRIQTTKEVTLQE